MPLFEVPGWSVASAPVAEPVTVAGSKKRKRPAEDHDSPEPIDLQKLVKKHRIDADGDDASTTSRASRVKALGKSLVRKTMDRKRQKKADALEEKKKSISLPKALMASEKGQQMAASSSSSFLARPTKRPKRAHEPADKPLPAIPEDGSPSVEAEPKATTGLTRLQKGMKEKLDGARFRLINETLYKSDSQQAHEMMQKDPKVYEEYHTGFRHQVQSWPTNPVQHYVSALSKYPPRTVIADLGCGDAAVARSLIPKGLNVLSFDLVSDGAFVIEADICDKIPLPGCEAGPGEKSDGQGQVVDVVVCALSLMGTNWPKCIREAWRILKHDGELKIAEVASRFTDVEEFSKLVSSIGFKLKMKNEANTHFTLFEFKKVPCVSKTEREWGTVFAKGSINILVPTQMNVLSHPIANAELSKLRRTTTTAKEFREAVNTISFILGLEASRTLEEESFTDVTPVAPFTGTIVKPRIGLTPILRAGLGMTDALAPIYHLGLFREKMTLQPVECASRLLDPLIATGRTACAALSMIQDWGMPITQVKLLCVLASQEGLDRVQAEFPELEIWVAGVDQTLTADGLISPGLGDAGDRLFNTLRP
ncbi:putative uracil phosphoribosyltransferase [Mycena maculata]|uniref:Ribosomal RNA-processing protein 8 n=1 Tax=Mycena maculata TaxID=230809 RepID=A0AAD7N364_9AGAR|nr:putative uracil phosphoribosyltransferase [Mycena maculata]